MKGRDGTGNRASRAARGSALALLVLLAAEPAEGARIRDLARLRGVRANDLIGYGLVVGLDGKGDDLVFTRQSLGSFLDRLGLTLDEADIRKMKTDNVAAVSVTAVLDPYAHPGDRIDVLVSSLGNADSLQGGTLLMTPLRGADGQVYAVGQGPITIGGFEAGGSKGGGNQVSKNHPTVGRIPEGARVEKEVLRDFPEAGSLTYALMHPSFTTAERMAEAINRELGENVAVATDAATVTVAAPGALPARPVELVSRIEGIEVAPDRPARVVINERTGTVVMGADVRVAPIALAHGNLTIEVKETLGVSQPAPFSPNGETVVVPDQATSVHEEKGGLKLLEPGVTISDLVRALNSLGVTPRDLIAIFQAIREAGALDAELQII